MIKPSKVIGENYLSRWHIIPRNPWFNIYLHKFTGSDDPRAPHDHPWWSLSFLLCGFLVEHYLHDDHIVEQERWVPWLLPVLRSARFAHRLELVEGPAWTVFITGPRVREWGFHCPGKGFVHWRDFSDETGLTIGKGCDE